MATKDGGGATPRANDPRTAIPTPVRIAGWIATLQGLAGVLFATYVVLHAATGYREETVVLNPYGMAGWFFLVFGPILAAGIGLLRGRRWGRGLVILAELLFLGVAIYAAIPSGQPLFGIVLGAIAIGALYCLFRSDSMEWYAA